MEGQNVSKGIFLTLVSILIFAVQDVAVKMLVTDYPPTQVVMIRFWGVAVFTLIWVLRDQSFASVIRSKRPFLQISRGVLLVLDIWCFSTALQFMPLSDLQAIFMLFPIVTTHFRHSVAWRTSRCLPLGGHYCRICWCHDHHSTWISGGEYWRLVPAWGGGHFCALHCFDPSGLKA